MNSWRDVKTTHQSYDGRRIKIGDFVESGICGSTYGTVTTISLKGRTAWLFIGPDGFVGARKFKRVP